MKTILHTFRRTSLIVISLLTLSACVATAPASAATSVPNRLAPCAVKVKGQKQPKTLTKTEIINFQTTKQNDSTLPQGQTKVAQAGQTGKRLITYTASYKKGKLNGCRHTGTQVTQQPVSQIVKVGTYVAPQPIVTTPAPTSAPVDTTPSCTNGTYVNSAGNTVCSPEVSSSAPAGATAQCSDGTYSFSQNRSGTCSHHGGVASWL